MSRKLKDELNIKLDDLQLLSDNIIVNDINIKTGYKNSKKNFEISCLKSLKKSILVSIVADVNFIDFLKARNVKICEHNLLNIMEEFAYNYYKNIYNKEEEDSNLNIY